MNPPPIGEAIGVGWQRFKEDPWPMVIGVLLFQLVCMIPIVGTFLGMPGLLWMGVKTSRGEKPEVGDAFIGFQKPIDHIMIGLFQILGMLACCIGIYVTVPMFYQGYLLVHERGMTWQQAKDLCLQETKPTWLGWTLFWFVLNLFTMLGILACFVGLFVTASVTMIALGYAYDQTLAKAQLNA